MQAFIFTLKTVSTVRQFHRYPRQESPKAMRIENNQTYTVSGIAASNPGGSKGKHKRENHYLYLDIPVTAPDGSTEYQVHYSRISPYESMLMSQASIQPASPEQLMEFNSKYPDWNKNSRWDAGEMLRDKMLGELRALYTAATTPKVDLSIPSEINPLETPTPKEMIAQVEAERELQESIKADLQSPAESPVEAPPVVEAPEAPAIPEAPVEAPPEAPKGRRQRIRSNA